MPFLSPSRNYHYINHRRVCVWLCQWLMNVREYWKLDPFSVSQCLLQKGILPKQCLSLSLTHTLPVGVESCLVLMTWLLVSLKPGGLVWSWWTLEGRGERALGITVPYSNQRCRVLAPLQLPPRCHLTHTIGPYRLKIHRQFTIPCGSFWKLEDSSNQRCC